MHPFNIHHFRTNHEGRYVLNNGIFGPNTPDGVAQCVNVSNAVAEHIAPGSSSRGNAIDLRYNDHARWIPNRPGNFPGPADIVIMLAGAYDPIDGHTGVALHGCDPDTWRAVWQNDPDGFPCHTVENIPYANVIGWWHFFAMGRAAS